MSDNIFKHSLGSYTNGKLYAVPYRNDNLKLVWDVTVIKKDEYYNSDMVRIKVVADTAIAACADAMSKFEATKAEIKALQDYRRADYKRIKHDSTKSSSEGTSNSGEELKPDILANEDDSGDAEEDIGAH